MRDTNSAEPSTVKEFMLRRNTPLPRRWPGTRRSVAVVARVARQIRFDYIDLHEGRAPRPGRILYELARDRGGSRDGDVLERRGRRASKRIESHFRAMFGWETLHGKLSFED